MTDPSKSFGPIRLSTDALPARNRLPVWREIFGRAIANLDLAPIDGRPFRESAVLYSFDGLGIVRLETNGIVACRTKELLADSDDDFGLVTNLSGLSYLSQAGRQFKMLAGSAGLMSAAEQGQMHVPEHAQWMSLRVPRRVLAALVPHPEDAVAREMPASNEALRMLTGYISTMQDGPCLTDPRMRHAFVEHVHDLLALSIGATRDATELASNRGLRAARLSAVKADIAGHIGLEGLSVADVARRQGVSPRYVQMLFEAQGTTCSEYLLQQRLKLAHRMLGEAALRDHPISVLAGKAGFGNLSYFNRAFRQAYGATPSEVRAATVRRS